MHLLERICVRSRQPWNLCTIMFFKTFLVALLWIHFSMICSCFLLLRELEENAQLIHYSVYKAFMLELEPQTEAHCLNLYCGFYCFGVTLYKLGFCVKGHKPLSLISVYPVIIFITCLGLNKCAVCMYNATLRGLFLLNKGSIKSSWCCIFLIISSFALTVPRHILVEKIYMNTWVTFY